jgi:hypothetical protein
MSKVWFRSSTGSSYGPASREGWAVLIGYVLSVTLVGVGLPMLAGGSIWSWILSSALVAAATFWLLRIVRTRSNRPG